MKKTLLATAVGTLMTISFGLIANTNSQMDGIFNSMVAVTPPGVHESQRRGVLSGGRLTVKNRIMDGNLISFVPPSARAGCNGIDLIGGSFSYISQDQLVQTFRTIAANAKGYAFQLMLSNAFPDGAQWIQKFQDTIRDVNGILSNSCETAKLLMDESGASAFVSESSAQLRASAMGLFDDQFDARQPGGEQPIKKLADAAPELVFGNIMWRALKSNNVSSWILIGNGSDATLELMMTITGTIIVGSITNDENGDETTDVRYINGYEKVQLNDLINGGQLTRYTCTGDTSIDGCLQFGETTIKENLVGFKYRMERMLLGDTTRMGIINKFSTNSGVLTDEEKALLANLPPGVGAIIRNLSVLSRDSAEMFVLQATSSIALFMMYDFVNQVFSASGKALASSKSPHKGEFNTALSRAQNAMRQDFIVLSKEYGELSQIIDRYTKILEVTRKSKYLSQQLAPQTPNQ